MPKRLVLRTNHIRNTVQTPISKACAFMPPTADFSHYEAVPDQPALLWEHIMTPGSLPNPRVIIHGACANIINHPTEIDIPSFASDTPPCTREHPTYGIIGLFTFCRRLSWLWRWSHPAGKINPVSQNRGMSAKVGSYWPFAPVKGRSLICSGSDLNTPNTRYILPAEPACRCYKVGFMPQWIDPRYLAGARRQIQREQSGRHKARYWVCFKRHQSRRHRPLPQELLKLTGS
jgi:hypothetical protein